MRSLISLPMFVSPHAKQKPIKKRKRNKKRTKLQKQQKGARRRNR